MSKLDTIKNYSEFDPAKQADLDKVLTGPKCKPVEGLGSGFPRFIQKENLFVELGSLKEGREYGIQLDYKFGEFYEYDTVSKLVDQERVDKLKSKWKAGVGVLGSKSRVYTWTYPDWDVPNIIMTHNHPSNSSFSLTDLESFLSVGELEMRAVTEWYIHIMQRPDNIDKYRYLNRDGDGVLFESQRSRIESAYNKYDAKWDLIQKEYAKDVGEWNPISKQSFPTVKDSKTLQKWLNPKLVNYPRYDDADGSIKGNRYSFLHKGLFAEYSHIAVQETCAELGIPYSRVMRDKNLESDEIKDDFPKADDKKKPEEDLTEKKQNPTPEPRPDPTPEPRPDPTPEPRPTQKKIQVDVRYDVFPKNPRDRAKTGTNKRRNPYPWEDRDYFEKMRKENEAKKEELETTGNKQTVVESENPTQKRKAKTKGVKDMVEIVEPKNFDWVPLGRRAIGYGGDSGTLVSPNAKPTNRKEDESTILDRKKLVLKLLKQAGLSQIIVAGIMGNFHKETGGNFNPLATNAEDTNYYPSLGLAQWNGQFNGNTKNVEKIFNIIGRTIPDQIDYMFNRWSNYRTFKTKIPEARNAGDAGYLFAAYAEICKYCNEGRTVYYSPSKFMQSDRSAYAKDYYRRFNDKTDPLNWNSN